MTSRSLLRDALRSGATALLLATAATFQTANAWQIDTPGTELVLDFESGIPGVLSYNAEKSYNPTLAEPGEFHMEKQSSMRLSSESFAVQNPEKDFGLGMGVYTAFGADMDGDGASGQAPKAGQAGLVFARGGTGEGQSAALPEGNTGLILGTRNGAPHGTYLNTTLRIENRTGAPLTQWMVAMDVWYADADHTSATLEVSFSTDGTTFQPLATLTSANTVPDEKFQSNNPAHWSEVQKLGGTFTAPVPPGGFFYLRLARPEEFGSAADFLFDNIRIQGNP